MESVAASTRLKSVGSAMNKGVQDRLTCASRLAINTAHSANSAHRAPLAVVNLLPSCNAPPGDLIATYAALSATTDQRMPDSH